ncbi:hypothetical protein E5720_17635 [Rhodococcus sp. PAMC28707]|nr:hypothetical protein E5769_17890 [Rhodococcus sp. PAMC28705]QCB61147.1 hypothetical protein E5720_17635 [Rhodococcus sp. PAMC28707]
MDRNGRRLPVDRLIHPIVTANRHADYKNELVDNGPRYPGAAELSLATAQWVAFYNRERPHSYCHDLTPDHAEQLHYDRTRILSPEEALTQ